MNDMVQIRSVKQYFNDFLVEGLKNNTHISESDVLMIKQQILDAFRREIFGQIAFKLGHEINDANRDELANLEPVQNILKNSFRKWKRLCIICTEHGLGNLFQLEDLQRVLEETEDDPQEIVYGEDPGEDVTDQLEEAPVYLNGGVKIEENPENG